MSKRIDKQFLDAITEKVVVKKRVHGVYREWEDAQPEMKKTLAVYKKRGKKREYEIAKDILQNPFIGKWQYVYSNPNGEISLVKFPARNTKSYINKSRIAIFGHKRWEIYCLRGNLFQDVDSFKTKKQAEKAIYHYLKGKHGKT